MIFIVVFAIASGMLLGYRRGFLRSAFKLLMTILSVVISYFAAPLLADWVISATAYDDSLQASIAGQMEQAVEQQVRSELESAVSQYGISVTDDMVSAAMNTQLDQSQQADMLTRFSVPENVRQVLVQNAAANASGYAVNTFCEYVAGWLARMLIRVTVYAAVFLVVSLLLLLIYHILSAVLCRTGLRGLDRAAGALFGGARILIYVWIIFLLVHYLQGTSVGAALDSQISGNIFTAWIDSHNPLQTMADHLISSLV